MTVIPRANNGALTVPIASEPTILPQANSPASTAFAQINPAASSQANQPNSSPTASASSDDSASNRAIIAVSVIMALASIGVLLWYLRDRRQSTAPTKERDRRIRLIQSPRSILPLQTSFHPSMKSSFGFTGLSPDSPWSRTTVSPRRPISGSLCCHVLRRYV